MRLTATGRGIAVAALLCTAACASTPVRTSPQPFPRSAATRPSDPSGPGGFSTNGSSIANDALTLVGIAYRYGGATPETGFDCSGLTRFVMGRHGVSLPRTTAEQFLSGTSVSRSDLESGDLVFFSTLGPGPTHVGIVTDPAAGQFVHAPADGSRVRVDSLNASYWLTRWVGARRVF